MLAGFSLGLMFSGGGGPGGGGDVTAPTLVGQPALSSDGLTLTANYSEPLDPTSVPTLTLGGTSSTVASVNVSGSTVVGTLNTPAFEDEVITVSSSGAPIQDLAGNDAAALSSQAVTNNSTVLPTIAQIAAMNGGTNPHEFTAEAANLTFDAGTGLVTQNNDLIGSSHLTGAGATRPAYAAPDGSTVANNGKLPGKGYLQYLRANNCQLLNAALNRAQECTLAMIVEIVSATSLSRLFASVGTNARQTAYMPSGVLTLFGSAAGPALTVPTGEFQLLIFHFKGAAGAELWAKHFYATGNDGAGVATGFQEGRDVAAGNAGNFNRYATWMWDGAPNLTQRRYLRKIANRLCTWNPVSAPPVGGEDIRVIGDGDSKMAGNGGGGGQPSYLNLLSISGKHIRVLNKATGGDWLSGGGGVDAQYSGVNGIGATGNILTPTNTDFTLKQVAVIDAGTNDFANNQTSATTLAALDSLLAKIPAGVKKVVLQQCRGGYNGTQDGHRTTHNAGIVSRIGTTIDAQLDVDAVLTGTPGVGNPGWVDSYHYDATNAANVAAALSSVIASV